MKPLFASLLVLTMTGACAQILPTETLPGVVQKTSSTNETVLKAGGFVEGAIEKPGAQDIYRIAVGEKQILRIVATPRYIPSTLMGLRFVLFDGKGEKVARRESPEDLEMVLDQVPAGTYRLVVQAMTGSSGAYGLSLQALSELPATPAPVSISAPGGGARRGAAHDAKSEIPMTRKSPTIEKTTMESKASDSKFKPRRAYAEIPQTYPGS